MTLLCVAPQNCSASFYSPCSTPLPITVTLAPPQPSPHPPIPCSAAYWYHNLDLLIKYVNADGRVNAIYSNPSIYAAAKIRSVSLPMKNHDDYMNLIDSPGHAVWSGECKCCCVAVLAAQAGG